MPAKKKKITSYNSKKRGFLSSRIPKLSLRKSKLSKSKKVAAVASFVLVFGGIGTYILTRSQAATPVYNGEIISFHYLRASDGGYRRDIAAVIGQNDPETAWSADGKTLAYIKWTNHTGQIFIANPDGTNQRAVGNPITSPSTGNAPGNRLIDDISWTSDNHILYVIKNVSTAGGITTKAYRLNPTSKTSTALKIPDSYPECVSASPTTGQIIYTTGDVQIKVANADGTNARNILSPFSGSASNYPKLSGCPGWSYDGSKVAFIRLESSTKADLWQTYLPTGNTGGVLTIDGTVQPDQGKKLSPVFSPDGRYVTFAKNDGRRYIRTLQTGKTVPLVGSGGRFSWRPVFDKHVTSRKPVYRLYNPNGGYHLFTPGDHERNVLAGAGWSFEGAQTYAFTDPTAFAGTVQPVYRVYNPNAGRHFFTASAGERDSLLRAGWRDEGITFYTPPAGYEGVQPIYRLHNPGGGSHIFTAGEHEKNALISGGWRYEGIAYYGYANQN